MAARDPDDDRNKARAKGDPKVLKKLAEAQARLKKLKAKEARERR